MQYLNSSKKTLKIVGDKMNLRVENITTSLGDEVIIKDISFALEAGEVLALVGHNGAGKSTIMKTIMGMLDKTAGKITIQNLDQTEDFLAFKGKIAYLPEEPMLLTELTVMQHFQLYGQSYQIEASEFNRKVDMYVKRFELTDKLNEYPESLSKGMRQKVQTICAFLPDVPVIIIDEPFMGLDIYAVEYVLELMRAKLAQGTSILLTTHQLEHVVDLAHHFIVLKNGNVVEEGPVALFGSIMRGTSDA